MPADPSIYVSERLARCYASARPPVHEAICARLFAALPAGRALRSALDIGCGAGASTAALLPHATRVTGIDTSLPMLRQARRRLASAAFIQAAASALPIKSASIDLATAAGALNYTDIAESLAEGARVLAPGGHLALYGFSTGRVQPRDVAADASFVAFVRAFPWPSGYALDLARLPYGAHGLALAWREAFVVEITMSADEYCEYIMGETNVEAAIAANLSETDARHDFDQIFAPLFAGGARRVGFESELALARRAGDEQAAID